MWLPHLRDLSITLLLICPQLISLKQVKKTKQTMTIIFLILASPPPPPTHLQCFSTLLLSAIFSPTFVQMGCVRAILVKSALMVLTRPPVDNDPMFTMSRSTSFSVNFWTYNIKENECSATIQQERIFLPQYAFCSVCTGIFYANLVGITVCNILTNQITV